MIDWRPTRAGKQLCPNEEIMETHLCKTCKVPKPADAFYRDPRRPSGVTSECKPCQRVRNQRWIDANRERFRHLNRDATNGKRRRDPIRNLVATARARAKKSGLEFSITEADLTIPEFCPVLGTKLTYGLGWGQGQSLTVRDTRASLDRIDNSKGYVPGNIIVVSYRANRIKSDATTTELLKIARFYARLDSGQAGQVHLPGMQPHATEKEREVPSCLAA